jgi:hypothetical protein
MSKDRQASGLGFGIYLRPTPLIKGVAVESARPPLLVMSARGQSETNVTTEPWAAVEWIADADLARALFYWDSVPHCRNPPSACHSRPSNSMLGLRQTTP